jgi:hypothetical protein
MTMDYLDFLHSSVTKTRALLFTPFETRAVYFHTLDELFGECGIDDRVPRIQLAKGGTRMDVYAGVTSSLRLGNLWHFMNSNGFDTRNVGTHYQCAVVVAFERLSGQHVDVSVDIHPSAFPWASLVINYVEDDRFFETWPDDMMVDPHFLMVICKRCKGNKMRCTRVGMPCNSCSRAGVECEPSDAEMEKRRRESHKVACKNVDVLCAVHQYIINMHGRLQRHKLHADATMNELRVHMLNHLVPGWNVGNETSLKGYADSYQHVKIQDGVMMLLDEKAMEDVWGFELDKFSDKRDKISVICPHLGMHDASHAYMLLDHAYKRPGELFYLDMCILTRGFRPVSRRVMCIASVITPHNVEVVLGWKAPKI